MRTIKYNWAKNIILQKENFARKKKTLEGNIKPTIFSKQVFEIYKSNALS